MNIDVDRLFSWLFWAGLAWVLWRFVPLPYLLEALWSRRRRSFLEDYAIATATIPSTERAMAIVFLYTLAIGYCFYDLRQPDYRAELCIRLENHLRSIRPRWHQKQIYLGLSTLAIIVVTSTIIISLCIVWSSTGAASAFWAALTFLLAWILSIPIAVDFVVRLSDDLALRRAVQK